MADDRTNDDLTNNALTNNALTNNALTNDPLTNDPLTNDTSSPNAGSNLRIDKEPATAHDVTEGGILGAVGGAIVGGLAGGPLGAIIGAVAGGAASAGAVDVVDKHDHDYARTVAGSRTDMMDAAIDDDETVNDHLRDASFATGGASPQADWNNSREIAGNVIDGSAITGNTINGEVVVPIVAEELLVGKQQVQSGGARIRTAVIKTPVEEAINLREEHVTVNRHTVDRPVTDRDTAFQDKTYEVTETSEVPVISKTARVVEEVVIGKTATDRTETVRDTVRRTDVEVEELSGGRGETDRH